MRPSPTGRLTLLRSRKPSASVKWTGWCLSPSSWLPKLPRWPSSSKRLTSTMTVSWTRLSTWPSSTPWTLQPQPVATILIRDPKLPPMTSTACRRPPQESTESALPTSTTAWASGWPDSKSWRLPTTCEEQPLLRPSIGKVYLFALWVLWSKSMQISL